MHSCHIACLSTLRSPPLPVSTSFAPPTHSADVSDSLTFPLTVPLLPFPVDEVLLPGGLILLLKRAMVV